MKRGLITYLDIFCIINLLVIIRIPVAFSLNDNVYARLLSLTPLLLSIFLKFIWFLKHPKTLIFVRKIGIISVSYWLLLFLALFQALVRDAGDFVRIVGNFSIPVIVMIYGLSLSVYGHKTILDKLPRMIYLMLLWYVLVNILLLGLNLYNRAEVFFEPRQSTLMSYLGLTVNRITFPTATGINSFGYIACLVITGGVILILKSRGYNRFLGLLGLMLGLIIVFLVDSRAALGFSILSIMVFYFTKRTKFVIWLSMLMPLFLLIFLRNLPTDWVLLISRGGLDALTLSNRTIIWQSVLEMFSNFEWEQLFGYGYRGQITSGLMEKYSYLFFNYRNVTAIPLHNSFLQNLVELGYVGLITFIMLLYSILNSVDHQFSESELGKSLIRGMLIFLIISSSMDSVLSISSQETFIVFIMIVALLLITQQGISKKFRNGKRRLLWA